MLHGQQIEDKDIEFGARKVIIVNKLITKPLRNIIKDRIIHIFFQVESLASDLTKIIA